MLIQQTPWAFGSSPYDSGYDHGCDDAGLSPSDQYITEPGKGPSYHTDEFMTGYDDGFTACFDEGGSEEGEEVVEDEDASDSEYCYDDDNDGYCDDDPSVCIDDDENDVCDVDEVVDEVPSTPDINGNNRWMNACSTVQQFLYQSCDSYVDSDGILTSEGKRAVVCIRNGAVLAAGGTLGGVPPSIAADILGGLAEMTGCGGIVDMQEVKRVVTMGGLTDISSLSQFLP